MVECKVLERVDPLDIVFIRGICVVEPFVMCRYKLIHFFVCPNHEFEFLIQVHTISLICEPLIRNYFLIEKLKYNEMKRKKKQQQILSKLCKK